MMFNIITLFPEFFHSPLQTGVLGRALKANLLKVHFINPRDYTQDLHKTVDDKPFGGGDGQLLLYHPLKKALKALPPLAQQKVVYLSPQGKTWDYQQARKWATLPTNSVSTFICGRYAGVDQRFISQYVSEEISVGDYVLTGGEPAMLVILDSIARFIKGVLGNLASPNEESFENNHLLEAPQWTRPQHIEGFKIPSVMFSGHHQKIKHFRYLLSLLVTLQKRPTLLTEKDKKNLAQALKLAKSLSQKERLTCGIVE